MIVVLIVASFGVLMLSTLVGHALAQSATHLTSRTLAGTPQAIGTIAALIPALWNDQLLCRCLSSLAAAANRNLVHVVVILPGGRGQRTEDSAIFPAWVRVDFIEATSPTSKAAAVLHGLARVDTDWVVLLDSDTTLRPDGLSRLTDQCRDDVDAVFGVIRPCRRASQLVLDLVVDLDKALSHGVFRAGRAALGLWPNLPGQCYIIRTDLLRRVYSGRMGYLDDLMVTLRLIALEGRTAFLPQIVADEDARATWRGYIVQRARWTIGLIQAGMDVTRASGRRTRTSVAWALHAWLYYGWPLAISMSVAILAAFQLWWPALTLSVCHVSVWAYLALRGRDNLAKWESCHNVPPLGLSTSLLAAGLISIIPCIGAAAALVIGLLDFLGCRPIAKWVYIR